MSLLFAKRRNGKTDSFTLVELLTVILIISILLGITIMAAEAALNAAARSRARAEVAAMGAGLDNYKTDNGAFPSNDMAVAAASYSTDPTSSGYTTGAQILFQGLTGMTNFTDQPTAGSITNYMTFKANQITGNTTSGVQDPFGYAYGYNIGDAANPPFNSFGFFDLWSTGGAISTSTNPTSNWISNWSQ